MSAKDFGLACVHCEYVFPSDITMGVAAAHFETEHDTKDIQMNMVVLCNRCGKPMKLYATVGREDHYSCTPCQRARIVRRTS